MPSRLDRLAGHPATLAFAWMGASVAMAALGNRFWIPLDDGTLAQSAERVLRGELPHRDFGDPYTGLNAVLGALSFRLFGVSLPSLRIPLALGFAAWLPALWLVARRFARPGPALAATALAAVLSVPAYPAAMPTWFGLFLTTWGLWLLLRFLETGERRWLVGVGFAAGVSILFKVIGLYFVAAVLLTLAWHRAGEGDPTRAGTDAGVPRGEGRVPDTETGAPAGPGRGDPDAVSGPGFSTWNVPLYPPVAAAGVLAFLLVLGRLVLGRSGPAGWVHFFLPGLVLGGALVVRSWRRAGRAHHPPTEGFLGRRLPRLLADGAVLAAATLLPVLLYLIPYAASDSVHLWVSGVFLLPGERFRFAASPAGSLWTVLPGLVGVGVLLAAGRVRGADRSRLAAALAVLLLAAVALDDAVEGRVFAALWYGARSWTPWLVAWGAWVAVGRGYGRGHPGDGGRASTPLYAVVATAGLWALVQFPWVSPAYFFYLAPLAVLATLAVTARTPVGHGPVLGVVAGLHLILGLGYAGGVLSSGEVRLPGERGGILVPAEEARVYGALTRTVRARLAGGGLWATPDAPEVYFLAGAPNPTPILYEFLGAPGGESPEEPPPGTEVVVLNTRPLFSPFPAGLEARLRADGFTGREEVGSFVVLWRGESDGAREAAP